MDVVEKKAAGEEIEAPAAAPAAVVDLMEALKASVEAAKGRTPSAGGAKRSTAKRSSAKRSSAKSHREEDRGTRKKAAAG